MSLLVLSLIVLGGLALVLGVLLAVANLKLAVPVDPRLEQVRAALPGSNCGACGWPGCDAYAEKVARGEAPPILCTAGGAETAQRIGSALGITVEVGEPMVAALVCKGGRTSSTERFVYDGTTDCRAAAVLHGGNKDCPYGCVGHGHCATVCPFGAITIGPDRLPVINEKKCTACGICVRECPKHVLVLVPRRKLIYLACVSPEKGRDVSRVCTVGCIGCTICVKACPYQALRMAGNLPVMDPDRCVECGICYYKCPTRSFNNRTTSRQLAEITDLCTGCAACTAVCQFRAVEGRAGARHRVLVDHCTGCRRCLEVCPVGAIVMHDRPAKAA